MKTLLIATSNPGKIEMFRELLNWIKLNLIFLSDLDYKIDSPVEDWLTVEANALLKARYYSDITWFAALADDAWFEIDELGWEPWIMARRWNWLLPDTTSDQDWLNFYMERTKDIPWEKLNASFPFSRCLYLPSWEHFFQSDKIPFYLSRIPVNSFKPGWPISALRIFKDWRQEMDVPLNDEVWHEWAKKEGLWELLGNMG
jgi:XTP/dITP diphosphohydrolase